MSIPPSRSRRSAGWPTSAGAAASLPWCKGKRQRPDPATFAGSGKVEEIAAAGAVDQAPRWCVFNHELSPAQQRNLRRALQMPRDRPRQPDPRHLRAARPQSRRQAAGRARAARASGHATGARLDPPGAAEGRHRPARPRRDAAGDRPAVVAKAGESAEGQARDGAQAARRCNAARACAPTVLSVSLVGYTNAGKSTLFNRLDARRGLCREPAVRHARHDVTADQAGANGAAVVMSDTVGFIRDLPPTLVAAFRATLEETVRPICSCTWWTPPARRTMIRSREVNKVLAEIGAAAVPQVMVFNKIDADRTARRRRAGRVW